MRHALLLLASAVRAEFTADFASLDTHQAPEWFRDATRVFKQAYGMTASEFKQAGQTCRL